MIDDDAYFTKKLQKDFHDFFKNETVTFVVKNNHFLDMEFNDIDVAFIDIDLISLSGIDLAKYLKYQNPSLKIIFVSSREELVFQTLTVDVFQFIRKSQYDLDIQIVFNQLNKALKKDTNRKVIQYKGRPTLFLLNQIEYIIAIGHEVIVYMNEKEYIFNSSLKEVIDLFQSPTIIQIKRNFCINLYFVKVMTKCDVVTLDNVRYEVGRKFQNQLIEKYQEFLLR